MANPEFENQLRRNEDRTSPSLTAHVAGNSVGWLDYLEGRLPSEEAQAVEAHLAVCPECQALRDQWRDLDTQLARALPRPQLSSGFAARLWGKIEHETAPGGEAARTQRRQQLSAELEARWTDYRRRFLRTHLPGLLDHLGYGASAAAAGYLLFHLLVGATASLAKAAPGSPFNPVLAFGTGATVAALIAGFAVAARPQLRRLLARL